MENVKVYKMNDYEWWASTLAVGETNKFFNEYYDDENDEEEIVECDIDKEGMWWETEDKIDLDKLGDSDEMISDKKKPQFGELMKKYGEVYKFITFRDALAKCGTPYDLPFCIASTEW